MEAIAGCRRVRSSFSGLVEQVDFDGRDLDASQIQERSKVVVDESLPAIFEFDLGSCRYFHACVEHLEFTDPTWDEFIEKKLSAHNYEPQDWWNDWGMVQQVIGTELEPCLVLQSLERKGMEEMNFTSVPGFLWSCLRLTRGLFVGATSGVGKSEKHRISSNGYLKGLVDLIFGPMGSTMFWTGSRTN